MVKIRSSKGTLQCALTRKCAKHDNTQQTSANNISINFLVQANILPLYFLKIFPNLTASGIIQTITGILS